MENTKIFEIVKEAYIYAYPIVEMYELLDTQVLNKETRSTGFNEFAHTSALASPKTSFIPAPNNDTAYSRAWLDVREEPVIILTPDTNDRYYSIQFLDLFSETIANVGRRLTGTKANIFAVVGPDWKGELPKDIQVIFSPTTLVLAFLRLLIKDEQDLKIVKGLQREFCVVSLTEYQKKTLENARCSEELPAYKNKNYYEFFETFNKILSLTPILASEQEFLKCLKPAGIGPGCSAPSQIPENIMNEACTAALKMIDEGGMQFGELENYWRIARKGVGNYGNDYLQRSAVWFKGALANQPEESLYPSTFQDSNGELLEGKYKYRLNFEKKQLPPVSQFWSLTMYLFENAFLIENEIDRYSIGDRTEGLVYESDGSLNIYIQKECPSDAEKKANWLPAPEDKFYMTLRLYGPSPDAVEGIWLPPAVERVV